MSGPAIALHPRETAVGGWEPGPEDRGGFDCGAVYVRMGTVDGRFPRPSNVQKRSPLFML